VGAFVLAKDPENKWMLIPAQFGHLQQTPTERVQEEEAAAAERASEIAERRAVVFDHADDAQHQGGADGAGVRVSVGRLHRVLLFYNGVIVGFVAYDYIMDGQGQFLAAWLLPHGVPELMAIFIGGQAGPGAGARGDRPWQRAAAAPAAAVGARRLATLAGGLAVMLVYAG
jgi:hypothetical protein